MRVVDMRSQTNSRDTKEFSQKASDTVSRYVSSAESWWVGKLSAVKRLARPPLAFNPRYGRQPTEHGGGHSVNNPGGMDLAVPRLRGVDAVMGPTPQDTAHSALKVQRSSPTVSRRVALNTALALPLPAFLPRPAGAFDNRLPPDELQLKYKVPRTAGPKPTDIGIQDSKTPNALKPCTDDKPHCFSSSPGTFEDADLYGAGFGETAPPWLVDPFTYEKPLAEAFADVKDAIAGYQVGQRGIDGGGFKLIDATTTDEVAYVYAQFESLRKGYIDDMEFAMYKGTCNVRTSSRLGYLDRGVNAKRYQWFADALRSKGWKTTPLRRKGHEFYFDSNELKDSDMTKFDVVPGSAR